MPERVQLISVALLAELRAKAPGTPRGRINHNFHASAAEPIHRFLNVLTRGTYVRPHRHLNPPKHESFLVLEGRVAVFVFDDEGAILERWELGNRRGDNRGIELPAGLWHTVAALSPDAVCYEVKPGPWDPGTDKEFASWAPQESDTEAAAAYLSALVDPPAADGAT